MVLTREFKSIEGALRLLAVAGRELEQADSTVCKRYEKQIGLLATLADSISRRVYADMEDNWKARLATDRAKAEAEAAEDTARKQLEAKYGWRKQITGPLGNEHAD